ncbi:MAG: hypothetical protein WC869_00085 [Phycisphaerae bacterium]|jgi:hypothetical protein
MSCSSLTKHVDNLVRLDKMLKASRGQGFDCEGLTITLRIGGDQSDGIQSDGRTLHMEVTSQTKAIVELLFAAEKKSAVLSAHLVRSGIADMQKALDAYMASPLTEPL